MAGESPHKQRILLVTGMLGAGKSTALRELEDLGWEAIDNFPIRLLGRLIGREGERTDGEAAEQADGKIVDRFPAEILQLAQRGRLAGAEHAGDKQNPLTTAG